MHLLWWRAADETMARIESDASLVHVHRAVLRTLGRLEVDPFDRGLRTRQFVTEQYGQMRSTPVGVDEWRIMWKTGPEADQLTIAFIGELSL